MFRKRVEIAKRMGGLAGILSARYFVLAPNDVIHPYDLTLSKMPKPMRDRWTSAVSTQLLAHVPRGGQIVVMAGAAYMGWVPVLQEGGRIVTHAFGGLPMGRQLAAMTRYLAAE